MIPYKILRFTAPWCGPCKILKPIYDEIVKENPNPKIEYKTIDVDEDAALSVLHQVRGIPTIIYLKNDREVFRLVGFREKQTILDGIERLLND